MHAATVAISELYNAALADRIAADFGLPWESRQRGRDRNPAWEIAAVPQELITEFSARARDIDATKDQLIADYVAKHGRQPSPTVAIKLRQQATLVTRPRKEARSLTAMSEWWRDRATKVLGRDATGWAIDATRKAPVVEQSRARRTRREPQVLLRWDDIPAATNAELATSVLRAVGDKRATWTRWNLHAEATRQMMGWRFAPHKPTAGPPPTGSSPPPSTSQPS